MKKLCFLLLFLAVNSYGQTTFSPAKYASTLMTCYYTFYTSLTTALAKDCDVNIKQNLTELCTKLSTELAANKGVITKKLGAENVKMIEGYLHMYSEYAKMDLVNDDERGAMILWALGNQGNVEKLFIKLKQ